MTRKSKREIENALDQLDGGDDEAPESIAVVYRDPKTGDLVDRDGDPVDPDADLLVVYDRAVVMKREDAEAEGREILGPAESETNPDADLVRVPWGDS